AGHDVLVVHAAGGAAGEPGSYAIADFAAFADETTSRERAAAVLAALDRFGPDVVHLQSNNNFRLEAEIRRRYASLKTLHVYDFCPSGNKYHHALRRPCRHPTGPLCVPRMAYKRCVLDKRPAVIVRAYRRAVAANRSNAGSPMLIVASEHVRRAAMASGYPAAQVRTLPYFTVLPSRTLPPPPASATVLFSGRLVREKGLHTLLAAVATIDRPWTLLVAGDGMDRPYAVRVAQRLGLADRVRFLGWLDRDDVARCYAEAAVVALPSLWPEPFAIVGLEAMAFGRPVVAFDVGGIREWLADGETGFLVPAGDVGAMADRLTRVLEDPALAASLGARGRARVERDFSPGDHLDRLLRLYADVTSAFRASDRLVKVS
ncbi:MAG TPA: glycosyltransferase family 4 protein, partial [Candidatus Limnocylindrales bacterium]|nr:glycosyltransferase family 4 protein [Candidatus Limnocylindrales bacterium]